MLEDVRHSMLSMGYDLTTKHGRIAYALELAFNSNYSAAGRAIGVSGAAVGMWVSGRIKNPENEHLLHLADLAGLNLRWLITGTGPERRPTYDDRKIAHMIKVMEQLPPYAQDEAMKDVDSIAELVRRATQDINTKRGNGA
jgi:transcriptional regulator with XRE-family HTH domain